MNTIGKLTTLFFIALAVPTALAEDGSNRALSGVRPVGPPPHVQKKDVRPKTNKQVDKDVNEMKSEANGVDYESHPGVEFQEE